MPCFDPEWMLGELGGFPHGALTLTDRLAFLMASSAQWMSISTSLPVQVLRMSTCFCTLRQISFTIWSTERLCHVPELEQHCQFSSLL